MHIWLKVNFCHLGKILDLNNLLEIFCMSAKASYVFHLEYLYFYVLLKILLNFERRSLLKQAKIFLKCVYGSTALSPGAVLIVKYCATNISANVNCITMNLSTISLWL